MSKQEFTTKQGLEDLRKELDYLKNEKTREIAELIRHTASFGDLKENAAYHDAKEKQLFLQMKIKELEDKISNSEIVEKTDSGVIDVGSKIKLLMDGEEQELEIVSPTMADSMKGKISYDAPLGQSIMNRKVGEEFEVDVSGNKFSCKILEVK